MRRLLFASLLAFAMPVAAVQAQADAEPQTPPIKAEMKKFDKALDAVIDFLEDGKKGEDLPMAEVAAAQAALQASKQHPPRITGQQPKDKQAEFMRDYRIAMNKMIRSTLDLEDALLNRDWKGRGEGGRRHGRAEEDWPPHVQGAAAEGAQVAGSWSAEMIHGRNSRRGRAVSRRCARCPTCPPTSRTSSGSSRCSARSSRTRLLAGG